MSAGPYRAGPWPGLTPRGAWVLMGCALLLACEQVLTGEPQRPLPDLPLFGLATLVPLLLAARVVYAPGAAAAACGAYLLPRTLVSLVDPNVQPPPLLLVPTLAFEVAAWLRVSDLSALQHVWPTTKRRWRTRDRGPRRIVWWRGALAGAIFGVTLSLIEPPFAVLLGADPATWSGSEVRLASGLCAAVCAMVGLGLNDRGTES